MAYPGVFLADDATIFRAMSAAGNRGGLICMHAENGIVINEIIKRALAARANRAEISRLDAPDDCRSRRRASRDCDCGNGGIARLYRAFVLHRRAQSSPRSARPRHRRVCRNLPAVSFSFNRRLRRRFRRREICDDAAAARKTQSGGIVERLENGRFASHLDRPLPVLYEGAKRIRHK